MPQRMRESRADHTKKLVQAAFELVPQVGIAGLRTRDIVKKAGVHLATFHYCFESKDALLVVLYQEIIDRLRAVIDEYITPRNTAAGRLEGHRRLRHYLLVEDRPLLIVWKAFLGAMWTDPKIADLVRPHWREMRDRFSVIVKSGQEDGYFDALPHEAPDMGAALVLGLFDGALTQMWLDPEMVPMDRFEQALSELYDETPAGE